MLKKLSESGTKKWDSWKHSVLESAVLMSTQQEETARRTREERSDAPVDKFRTAKRFSIARARSLDALHRSRGAEKRK